MKYLQLCFAVFSIGVIVIADRVTFDIEEAQDRCRNVTKIDQTLIDQAQNGQFSDTGKLRDYYFCFDRKIGFIKKEYVRYYGKIETKVSRIDREALRNWLEYKLQYDSETTEHTLSSCGLDKPDSDVFQSIKCLSENKLPVDVISPNYVDHSVEEINELHDMCKNDFNVDQNLINDAQNGNVVDSESLEAYYTCYLLNTNLVHYDGSIEYNSLKNWFKLMLRQESVKVDSALHRCYKPFVDLNKIEEEVMQIVKCFVREKLPIDVVANQ